MLTILFSSAMGSRTVHPFSGNVSLYSKANKGNLWERGNAYCCSFSKTFLREWFSWKGTKHHKALTLYLLISPDKVTMQHTLYILQQFAQNAMNLTAEYLQNSQDNSVSIVTRLKAGQKMNYD